MTVIVETAFQAAKDKLSELQPNDVLKMLGLQVLRSSGGIFARLPMLAAFGGGLAIGAVEENAEESALADAGLVFFVRIDRVGVVFGPLLRNLEEIRLDVVQQGFQFLAEAFHGQGDLLAGVAAGRHHVAAGHIPGSDFDADRHALP